MLEELRLAIEFFKRELAIANKVGDRGREGEALNNLGNTHIRQDDFREAVIAYLQCWASLKRPTRHRRNKC